jgi:hypothetical protein
MGVVAKSFENVPLTMPIIRQSDVSNCAAAPGCAWHWISHWVFYGWATPGEAASPHPTPGARLTILGKVAKPFPRTVFTLGKGRGEWGTSLVRVTPTHTHTHTHTHTLEDTHTDRAH